ncbi:MAG: peroxiredoxin [Pelagibacteraceae bacterium TMED136]|nr:MAG: peroxiredoxin [Pelagibacteraceae bacterium TMED136]|tara:strand:+ start:8219 stop:8680 length:462 start_codon:yes stop_codon:yes gene_type:complete
MIKENKILKDFKLPSTSGKTFQLKKELKKNLIIYIYPKDNTPGCTTESVEFAKCYEKFKKINVQIFGLSKDSIDSHLKFKMKYKFPFELLSDEELQVIKMLGAWGEKTMYGKKFMGVKRTTILIGKNQKVIKIWKNVKVKDHVKNILEYTKII